jgi:hypothetical protein
MAIIRVVRTKTVRRKFVLQKKIYIKNIDRIIPYSIDLQKPNGTAYCLKFQ